ncbi:1228_t:CDS:2, partial [Gigaspora margarita]
IEPLIINPLIPMETSPLISTQNQKTISSESIAHHASDPTVTKFLIYPTYVDQTQKLSTEPETQSEIINQEVITGYYFFVKALED